MVDKNSLNIAISGAGGFLGSAVVQSWIKHPRIASLRGLYHFPEQVPRHLRANAGKFQPVVGDLANAAVAESLVQGADVVVHFASHGFPSDKVLNPRALMAENINTTESLVRAMEKNGVKRILHASTGGGLYCSNEQRIPLKESAPVEIRSAYSLYKIATEQLLSFYALKGVLEPISVRISNPYGPGQLGRERQGFFGVAFQKAIDGTSMPIWGSVETCKDFIYIGDAIEALESFIWSPFREGLYNLGSGVGATLHEGIELVQKVTGVNLSLERMPAKNTDSSWTILDISKIQKATGWKPKTSLEAGLTATWEAIQYGLKKAA